MDFYGNIFFSATVNKKKTYCLKNVIKYKSIQRITNTQILLSSDAHRNHSTRGYTHNMLPWFSILPWAPHGS